MLKIALNIAWIAIVLAGMATAVVQFRQHTAWAIAAILIGSAMLVIYAAAFAVKIPRLANFANRASDYAVALLIIGAILVLAASLILGFRRFGLVVDLVLVLFLCVFLGILRDYLKHLRKKAVRRKST